MRVCIFSYLMTPKNLNANACVDQAGVPTVPVTTYKGTWTLLGQLEIQYICVCDTKGSKYHMHRPSACPIHEYGQLLSLFTLGKGEQECISHRASTSWKWQQLAAVRLVNLSPTLSGI